jgi:hypothetical protein
VLLVDVVNQLATHAHLDHAVGKRDGVVAVAIVALVRSTILLGAHIDLAQGALKLGIFGLRQQAEVVLGDAGDF